MDRDGAVTTARATATSRRAGSDLLGPRRATAGSPTTSATRTPTASPTTTRSIGPLTAGWWKACYSDEAPYPIKYAGTEPFDADSDGDGVLDGADDQDFDDVPNIMELSRNMAGDRPLDPQDLRQRGGTVDRGAHRRRPGEPVQPVPAGLDTRGPARAIPIDRRTAYAPFDPPLAAVHR